MEIFFQDRGKDVEVGLLEIIQLAFIRIVFVAIGCMGIAANNKMNPLECMFYTQSC